MDMKKIMLDTNFLLIPFQFKVDIFSEIERICNFNYKLCIFEQSLEELNKFCEALISIRKEIEEISSKKADVTDNVLKNAPHTAKVLIADEWKHAYSREKAAYPIKWVRENKFWPSVGKIDNAHGDRNLICACLPIENYVSIQAEN